MFNIPLHFIHLTNIYRSHCIWNQHINGLLLRNITKHISEKIAFTNFNIHLRHHQYITCAYPGTLLRFQNSSLHKVMRSVQWPSWASTIKTWWSPINKPNIAVYFKKYNSWKFVFFINYNWTTGWVKVSEWDFTTLTRKGHFMSYILKWL